MKLIILKVFDYFVSFLKKIKSVCIIALLIFSNFGITLCNNPIEMHWSTNPGNYSDNMTVTAVVVQNDVEMSSDLIEIGAFSDEECRGSILLEYISAIDRHIGFLMVYGNGNETITLRVYNHETETEHTAINTPLVFTANAVHGTPLEPYVVLLSANLDPPIITTATLLNGKVDMEYHETIVAEGDEPITWNLQSGNLPSGLTLSSEGVISGTPSLAGIFNFIVRADNAVGYDTSTLSIHIEKGEGAIVNMPTLDAAGATTINIYAVTPPANGQAVEYCINTIDAVSLDWQSSTIFSNLSSNTIYYIYARTVENANYYAGFPSESLEVITEIDPGNDINEHQIKNPLKAWVNSSHLYVKGLTIGKTLSIYTVTGALIYQKDATLEEAVIPLVSKAVYIVQQGKYVIKVN